MRKHSALLALVLIIAVSAFGAAGCGDGERKPPPSPTATPASAGPTPPSPSPTGRPTLDAAARFGAVQTAALPGFDEHTTWMPQQLIPGSHLFLVYHPPGYLDCASCQFPPGDPANPGRLGLWDVDTGTVDEFRTLEPGEQLPATGSDGRYLAWAEGCHTGMGGGWHLYAMDLTTREWWQVDADFATVSGDSSLEICPPALAVADGRLVYSTAIANLSGNYVFELRTYHLATRTRSVLKLSGDAPPIHIGCSACGTSQEGLVAGSFRLLYVDNGRLFWVVCSFGNACTTSSALYVTDLSNGDTRTLASKEALDSGGILRFLTGSDQGRDASRSLWTDQMQITPGFVLWVNEPENVAMAFDRSSGDLIKLSDCARGLLAADDSRIYWTCEGALHWVAIH
jgi:hypothetical protein